MLGRRSGVVAEGTGLRSEVNGYEPKKGVTGR